MRVAYFTMASKQYTWDALECAQREYSALTFAQQPPKIREKLPIIGARAAMIAGLIPKNVFLDQ